MDAQNRIRIATALVALALAPFTLRAQVAGEPHGSFGERVEVEVVNVDVVVTDEEDHRVFGLERGDFELLIDGRPVPIEYFSAPEAPPPTAPVPVTAPPSATPVEAEPAAEPSPPSDLVLYVDQSALAHRIRQQTLAELREFVAARAREGERVTIAAFQDDLRLLAVPTSGDEEIEAAFEALEQLPTRASLIESERRSLEHEIRRFGRPEAMVRSSANEAGNVRSENDRRTNESIRIQAEIELWAERELDRQRSSLRALSQLVSVLGALEGRKSVVLATGGFDSAPGTYLLQFFAQKQGLKGGSLTTRVARLDELGIRLAKDFEEVVATAQNARVSFYTVRPRDLAPEQNSAEFKSAGAGQAIPPPRDTAAVETGSSVARLAAATGGRALVLDEGLDHRLEGVRSDAEAVYSLGFTVGPEAGDRSHRLEVRTRRYGLELRHRESFRRRSDEARAEQALLANATLGQSSNPAGLALDLGAPVPLPKRRQGAVVPFTVRIPLGAVALLPDGSVFHGRLSVRVAVCDAAGRVLVGESSPIGISVPVGELAQAVTKVWTHRAEMRLTPGRHRLAVLVFDELGGAFSTISESVEVPGG